MTGAISSIGNTVKNTVSTVADAALSVPKAVLSSSLKAGGEILSTPGAAESLSALGSIGGAAIGVPNIGSIGGALAPKSSSPAPQSNSQPVIISTPPAPVSNSNTPMIIAIGAGVVLVAFLFLMRRK